MLILKLRLKTARELIQLEHDATMGSLRVAIVRSSVSQSPSTIKAPRWVDLWQCVAFPEGDLLEIGSFSPFAHSECRTVCHRTPTGLHHSERTKYWLLKCETENDLLLTLAIENPSSSNSQRLISESFSSRLQFRRALNFRISGCAVIEFKVGNSIPNIYRDSSSCLSSMSRVSWSDPPPGNAPSLSASFS